jgi:ubiquinone/menaquinone biosynthesis C-methylase UbiE
MKKHVLGICMTTSLLATQLAATPNSTLQNVAEQIETTTLTAHEQQTVDYYNQHGKTWVEQHFPADKISFYQKEIELFKQLAPSGSLLEIGSGGGVEAHELLKETTYNYVGIDISPTLLATAQQRNPSAKFMEASVYNLPFTAGSFDAFWAAAVFLHVPKNRMDEAFVSLTTVLKPGACGFISLKAGEGEHVENETNRFFSYFTTQEFTQILSKYNFVVTQTYQKVRMSLKNTPQPWLIFFITYKPVAKSNPIN